MAAREANRKREMESMKEGAAGGEPRMERKISHRSLENE